eukprot:jgi/Mesvir1/328/Mv22735-RA.1
MDALLNKALDALEPLQTKALDAMEDALNEFDPKAAKTMAEEEGPSPALMEAARKVQEAWEAINLGKRKQEWDEMGLQIAQAQEEGVKSRKKLAEMTRDFKYGRSSDADKTKLIPTYQAAVDELTKRAKFAESSFMSLYRLFYDAPDPVDAISSSLDEAARLGDAVKGTRRARQQQSELASADAASVKALQATIRRLEERNAVLEHDMEHKVEQIVSLRAAEAEAALAAALEREQHGAAQLAEARSSVAALQRLHDKTQSALFEMQSQGEEETAAKQAELDAVTEEVERALKRAQQLERSRDEMAAELARLRQQAASNSNNHASALAEGGWAGSGGGVDGGGVTAGSSADLEARMLEKDQLLARVNREMADMEARLAEEHAAHMAAQEALHAQLRQCEGELAALRRELSQRPRPEAVDALKGRVRVLQALIDSEVADDWEDVGAEMGGGGESGSDALPSPAGLKRSRSSGGVGQQAYGGDASGYGNEEQAFTEVNVRAQEAEATVKQQETLILSLEEDLLRSTEELQHSRSEAGSSRAGRTHPQPAEGGALLASLQLSGRTGPLADVAATSSSGGPATPLRIVSGVAGPSPSKAGAGEGAEWVMTPGMDSGAQGGVGSDGSLLDIVCGQRDRLRARNATLELENRALQDKLDASSRQVEKLTNDNVSLFEKVRYLQRYNQQIMAPGSRADDPASASSNNSNNNNNSSRWAPEDTGIGGAALRAIPGVAQLVAKHGYGSEHTRPRAINSLLRGLRYLGSCAGDSYASVEGTYEKLYEEKMNPFLEFNKQEHEKSYNNLRLHDKITLRGGRFVLGNKYARMFFFIYTILLHLLVLLILYRSSYAAAASASPTSATDIAAVALLAPEDAAGLGLEQALGDAGEGLVGDIESEGALQGSHTAYTFGEKLAEKMGALLQTSHDITSHKKVLGP